MVSTVVGVFDDQKEAQDTRLDLQRAGFGPQEVHLESGGAARSADAERSGFWASVRDFLGLDETATYEEATRRGSTVVSVTTDEAKADKAVDIIRKHHPVDLDRRVEQWRQSGWEGASGRQQKATPATQKSRSESIPIVEEQLKVGKREVAEGGIRVFSHVTQKPVQENVQLREEHVHVERRPANRPAGPDAFQERRIEAREMREEPVISKEARVVEEVVLEKDVQQRTEPVKDTLRKTDVKIERLDDEYFRNDYKRNFGRSGLSYEQMEPAYQHGYELGRNPQHRGKQWSALEGDARRSFESRNPGQAQHWDTMKNAMQCGYDRACAHPKA